MKSISWNNFKNDIIDYPYTNQLDDFLKSLKKDSNIHSIYFFGSIINNYYDEHSDTDIIIVLFNTKGFKVELEHYRSISKYMGFIHLFPYSIREFNEYCNDNNHFLSIVEKVKVLL